MELNEKKKKVKTIINLGWTKGRTSRIKVHSRMKY